MAVTYYFEEWAFTPSTNTLRKAENTVVLKPLISKLLNYFITHPENCFDYDALKIEVWKQKYLTDSAVKKAISELRKELSHFSPSPEQILETVPQQGYRFNYRCQEPPSDNIPSIVRSWSIIAVAFAFVLAIATYNTSNLVTSSPAKGQKENDYSNTSERLSASFSATRDLFNHSDAYDNYIKGKVAYYGGQPRTNTESLLLESIRLQPTSNPSFGALLDLYGLGLRELPAAQRTEKEKATASQLMQKLSMPTEKSLIDNRVALIKYYLVNLGDLEEAGKLTNVPISEFSNAYDMHIPAIALALTGDKKKSEQLIKLAETRFPARNVIVWSSVFVSLINGEFEKAMEQAKWAQQVAPGWYPLLYSSSYLLNNSPLEAVAHLENDKGQFISSLDHSAISTPEDFAKAAEQLFTYETRLEPYEAELIYLYALITQNSQLELAMSEYIREHFPEKNMMLNIINRWSSPYTDSN